MEEPWIPRVNQIPHGVFTVQRVGAPNHVVQWSTAVVKTKSTCCLIGWDESERNRE